MENKQKTNLSEMMETSMSKVREMVSSDTVIGQPITTPDGVTRVMPVAIPAMGTADRIIEMVPQVLDRVENFIDKKKETADF